MENFDVILEELEKFKKESADACEVPELLDEYLKSVATNGETLFSWTRIQHLVRHKLSTVMDEFYEHFGFPSELLFESGIPHPNVPTFTYAPTRDKILEHFDTFTGVPFTIQRLCEILVDPSKHYKRTDKFLRGLEKNILIVSYIEPGRSKRPLEQQTNIVNWLEGGGMMHLPHLHGKRSLDLPDLPDIEMKDSGDVVASNGTSEENSSSSSSSSPPLSDDEQDDSPSPKRQKLESSHANVASVNNRCSRIIHQWLEPGSSTEEKSEEDDQKVSTGSLETEENLKEAVECDTDGIQEESGIDATIEPSDSATIVTATTTTTTTSSSSDKSDCDEQKQVVDTVEKENLTTNEKDLLSEEVINNEVELMDSIENQAEAGSPIPEVVTTQDNSENASTSNAESSQEDSNVQTEESVAVVGSEAEASESVETWTSDHSPDNTKSPAVMDEVNEGEIPDSVLDSKPDLEKESKKDEDSEATAAFCDKSETTSSDSDVKSTTDEPEDSTPKNNDLEADSTSQSSFPPPAEPTIVDSSERICQSSDTQIIQEKEVVSDSNNTTECEADNSDQSSSSLVDEPSDSTQTNNCPTDEGIPETTDETVKLTDHCSSSDSIE